MSHELMQIADRVLNTPLLLLPSKAEVILSVLGGRIGVNSPEASRFVGSNWEEDATGRGKFKPYKVADGVGIITITGSLVNRGAWIGASSGLTSYEGIQHQIRSAMKDDSVKSVVLDLHSPGGEAVGAFETAAVVRELSAVKKTAAVVNGMAASAAYAIASGASEIVTTETGVSGSIGVVLLHADFSRQLDREGITPTLIHAGARKVDGNPFQPLSKEVKSGLQAEVDALYEAFLQTVHKGRGSRLTVDAARTTEAETFIGAAAVAVGLADRVGTFETALAELARAHTTPNRKVSLMTDKTFTQAELDTAVTTAKADGAKEGKATLDAAVADATKAGATAERTRIKAVLDHEEAKERQASALHLALTTDMTAEQIGAALAGLPKAQAAAPGTRAGDSPIGLAVEKPGAKKEQAQSNWDDVIAETNKGVSPKR